MSTTEEQVLVTPTTVAIEALAYCARGMSAPPPNDRFQVADESILLQLQEPAVFVPRGPAETDPELKQLVVYAVVTHMGKILRYRRGKPGAELRLHAKHSIGVGGHINPEDWDPGLAGEHAFRKALHRELEEELKVTGAHGIHAEFLGLVNEDATEVGQVHLGLVYLIELDTIEGLAFEDALVEPEWLDESDMLACDTFELWSGLVRNHLFPTAPQLLPHQERVVNELAAREVEKLALAKFIAGSPIFGTLPQAEQDRLERQFKIMQELCDVLSERIAAF